MTARRAATPKPAPPAAAPAAEKERAAALAEIACMEPWFRLIRERAKAAQFNGDPIGALRAIQRWAEDALEGREK
jgi:hypothetical protein